MKQGKNINRVDRGWHQMNELLDDKMPQKKERKKILFIFFLFGLLTAFGTLAYVSKFSSASSHTNKEAVVIRQDNINLNKTTSDSKIHSSTNNALSLTTPLLSEEEEEEEAQLTQNKVLIQEHNLKSKKIFATINPNNNNSTKSKSLVVSNDIESFENNNNSDANHLDTVSTNVTNYEINILNTKELKNTESKSKAHSIAHKTEKQFTNFEISQINSLPIAMLTSTAAIPNPLAGLSQHLSPPTLITPIQNIWQLNGGIQASKNYISDFDVLGYEGGLFLELGHNNKWGFGVGTSYQFAKANTTQNAQELMDELSNENIELEDMPTTGLISDPNGDNMFVLDQRIEESEKSGILKATNTNFNALKLVAYSFYKPSKRTKVRLGLGLHRFAEIRFLENVYLVDDTSFQSTAFLTTVLYTSTKTVPVAELGFDFLLFNKLSASLGYSHALSHIINEPDSKQNTNTLRLGLSWTF